MLARTALRVDTNDEDLDTLSRVQQTLKEMPVIKRSNVLTDLASDYDLNAKTAALREFTALLVDASKNPSPAYAKEMQFFWYELRTQLISSGYSERGIELHIDFIAHNATTSWIGIGACGESARAFIAAYLAHMQEDEVSCLVNIGMEHAWAEVRKQDRQERPNDVIPEKWATGEADEPVAVFREDAHYPRRPDKNLGFNIPHPSASRLQKDIQRLLEKLKEQDSPAQEIFDRLVTKYVDSTENIMTKFYLESGFLESLEGLYVSAPSAFSKEFRDKTRDVLDGSSPPLSAREEERLDNALEAFSDPVLPTKKEDFGETIRTTFKDIAHKRATILELKGLSVAERLGMPATNPATARETAIWMTDSMKRSVLGKAASSESSDAKIAFDEPEIRLAKNLIGRLRKIDAGRTRENALKRLGQGGEGGGEDSDTEARVQNLLAQDSDAIKKIFARLECIQRLNIRKRPAITS